MQRFRTVFLDGCTPHRSFAFAARQRQSEAVGPGGGRAGLILADSGKGHMDMAQKQQNTDDQYARESFGMRRMTRGQVWAITVVAIVVVAGLLVYGAF
jgi:hypothetical protein